MIIARAPVVIHGGNTYLVVTGADGLGAKSELFIHMIKEICFDQYGRLREIIKCTEKKR